MRIAVHIETNRAHGRALLEGVGDYALAHPEWRLEAVEAETLTNASALRRFDGFIVRVMDDRTAEALLRAGRPAVDTYGRRDVAGIPYIRLDDAAIAQLAAQCFAEHRYRRCAYCGFPGLRFSEARGAAFRAAVETGGGECHVYTGGERFRETSVREERMDTPPDAESLRRWVRSLPKPVAVFCCSDLRALQLLGVCADAGISVPGEAAVLGCDDDTVLCTFANPPLSSIDTDAVSLGREAARMLDTMLAWGQDGDAAFSRVSETRPEGRISFAVPPPTSVLHPPRRVVERTSTDCYQVRTPWLSNALVHIRRHLGDGLNAAELCRHLGYSHTTVNKVFRAELGASVKGEIMRQRLERACRLLRETDRTAASIAAECGYPSAQYFAHTFAARLGTTPERWRRAHSS